MFRITQVYYDNKKELDELKRNKDLNALLSLTVKDAKGEEILNNLAFDDPVDFSDSESSLMDEST